MLKIIETIEYSYYFNLHILSTEILMLLLFDILKINQFLFDKTIKINMIILQDLVTENQDIPQNNTCFLVISVIIRSRGARIC